MGSAGLPPLYMPMHEVTPKVVAMAVNTVITMLRILLQRVLFSIGFLI
jgi:hypothetical protein